MFANQHRLMPYGELGRLPLSTIAKERELKFWIKIINDVDSLGYKMYIDSCNNIRGPSWAKRVNSIIDHLGFTDVRTAFDERINYLLLFKNRVRDQFIQDWKSSIDSSPKLFYYAKVKNHFEYEEYLDKISN